MNLLYLVLCATLIWTATGQICQQELEESCRPELNEKNLLEKQITSSQFPPLKDTLEKYNRRCKNVMKCAKRLECFEGKSDMTIFDSSCQAVATRSSQFYSTCIRAPLRAMHRKNRECAMEFDFEMVNSTLNKEVYFKSKNCMLEAARANCELNNHMPFLEKNYDELMELYTTKPNPDSRLCNSPYDRFYMDECENIELQSAKFANCSLLNFTNHVGADFLRIMRKMRDCGDNSCIVINANNNSKLHDEINRLEKIHTEVGQIFKERPNMLKYKCMETIRMEQIIRELTECVMEDDFDRFGCIINVIADRCREDIVEEFKTSEPSGFACNCTNAL